jgi:CelD/BcsL family acetyltransferase involved in cellulose biosynthesis
MNVRLVNDPVLADYHAVWDQLYDSTDCEPSASCEWTEALIRSRRLAVDEVLLAVIEDGRAVRGLLPLARSTLTKYGMSIRVLSPISELYNTHSELLVEREPAAAIVRAVFDALKSAHVEWDVFRMGRFFDGNPLVGVVGACAKAAGIRYLTRRHDPAFVLALDGTYDAYLKRRSSGFRNNLKRMAKKLAETGEARYRRADGSRSIEEEYQHVLDIEARSWKHERGT